MLNRIHHIAIICSDYRRSMDFYVEKLGFSVVPIILGVVLGDLVETNFRNSMILSGGSLSIFVTRPFSLLFLLLALVSIGSFFYKSIKKHVKGTAPVQK